MHNKMKASRPACMYFTQIDPFISFSISLSLFLLTFNPNLCQFSHVIFVYTIFYYAIMLIMIFKLAAKKSTPKTPNIKKVHFICVPSCWQFFNI